MDMRNLLNSLSIACFFIISVVLRAHRQVLNYTHTIKAEKLPLLSLAIGMITVIITCNLVIIVILLSGMIIRVIITIAYQNKRNSSILSDNRIFIHRIDILERLFQEGGHPVPPYCNKISLSLFNSLTVMYAWLTGLAK